MSNKFHIPAINMPRLLSEINKLNKRAARLKLAPIELEEVAVHQKEEEDPLGFKYSTTIYEIIVKGEIPKLNDWSLIAVIRPQRNNENLICEVPGEVCPKEYRSTDLRCEHCNTVRKRNAVYVLRCDKRGKGQRKGEFRQIGRNCLQDFLDSSSVEGILKHAETFLDVYKVCRDASYLYWGFEPKQQPIVELSRFLSVVAAVIRNRGWLPRSRATLTEKATADIAWDSCVSCKPLFPDIEITPADTRKADEALEWGKAISPDEADSNFIHNLGVVCRQDYVNYKSCGTLAALFSAFEKNKKAKAAKNKINSKHVGSLKERRVFENVRILGKHFYETNFGQLALVRFVSNGNILIWRTSSDVDWLPEKEEEISIKGTVKKHDYFNGVPQTIINRVVKQED